MEDIREEAKMEEPTAEASAEAAGKEQNAPDVSEAGETKTQQEAPADEQEEQSAQESPDEADEPEDEQKMGLFGRKRADKKDEQIAELKDRVTRQLAEFDNFRKRTEKEKAGMYEIGAKSVIEKILPVVDNFERGLATVEEGSEDPFVTGMEKIYKQLLTTLESLDVKPIPAVGEQFDPNYHNAIMHVEDESVGDNVIVEELQKGYMYRDSVVRHSMVKVAN